MPSLKATYLDFKIIIEAHGFVLHRHKGSSHQRWRGTVDNQVRYVDLTPHLWSDEIRPGTLKSMIRQCGLPASLFRK